MVARPRSHAPGELVDRFGRSDVGATLVVALLPADDQEPGEGPGMTPLANPVRGTPWRKPGDHKGRPYSYSGQCGRTPLVHVSVAIPEFA